jgi:hypothetical protein
MALKPCRECNAMVSDSAAACPHCGIAAPIRRAIYNRPMGCGTLILVSIVGLFVLVALAPENHNTSNDRTTSQATSTKPELDFSRPIFTDANAVVCPEALLWDNRAEHSADAIAEKAFASIWNHSEKVKEAGCQEWKAGIRVYVTSHRKNAFITFTLTPDGWPQYITLSPYLANGAEGVGTKRATNPPSPEVTATSTSAAPPVGDSPLQGAADTSISNVEVEEFMNTFIAESNAASNVDNLIRFYAEHVDYYKKGIVSKAVVADDKARYIERWPTRSYSVEGNLSIFPAGNGTDKAVAYVMSYSLSNGEKSLSGRADASLSLAKINGQLQIVRETGSVLKTP